MPIFWSGGNLHQGSKVDVEWSVVEGVLVLKSTGQCKSLRVSQTIMLRPPAHESMVARVEARTHGSIELDRKPGETFKTVFLSSMHISDLDWDCRSAFVEEDPVHIPSNGFIVPACPTVEARRFGLLGGTSRWKKNGPTVSIELDEPMTVAGWVTSSKDPNDDNIGLWAATDAVLPSWSYTIRADAGFSP